MHGKYYYEWKWNGNCMLQTFRLALLVAGYSICCLLLICICNRTEPNEWKTLCHCQNVFGCFWKEISRKICILSVGPTKHKSFMNGSKKTPYTMHRYTYEHTVYFLTYSICFWWRCFYQKKKKNKKLASATVFISQAFFCCKNSFCRWFCSVKSYNLRQL